MKRPTTAKEVLERTETLLTAKGWVQHRMRTSKGFCLVGALQQVCAGTNGRVFYEAIDLLKANLPYVSSLVGFNDRKGRQKKDIIALVQRAKAGATTI